jgi:hypothetical protein
VTTHRKLGIFFSSDFSSRLSGEDAQKDLTINGDSLSGMVELFLKPCYKWRPSYCLGTRNKILYFIFKKMPFKIMNFSFTEFPNSSPKEKH